MVNDIILQKETRYTVASPEPTLEDLAAKLQQHIGKAVEELANAGKVLIEVQSRLDGTSFVAFCESNGITRRSAYNWMRLHQHRERYGIDALTNDRINVSAWYRLPTDDTAAVNQAIMLAMNGATITQDIARRLVQVRQVDDPRVAHAWLIASQTAPAFFVECMDRNAITNLDGDDIPLLEADATLIRIQATQYEYERAMVERDTADEQRGDTVRTYVNIQSKHFTMTEDNEGASVHVPRGALDDVFKARERGATVRLQFVIIDQADTGEGKAA